MVRERDCINKDEKGAVGEVVHFHHVQGGTGHVNEKWSAKKCISTATKKVLPLRLKMALVYLNFFALDVRKRPHWPKG
jgi:hypothetical protein